MSRAAGAWRAGGLRVLPMLGAALLLGLAGLNLRRARGYAHDLTEAQGSQLGRQLRAALGPPDRLPEPAALAAQVEALSEDGLMGVFLIGPDGELLLSAGEPAAPLDRLPTEDARVLRFGAAARFRLPMHGGPGGEGGPPPEGSKRGKGGKGGKGGKAKRHREPPADGDDPPHDAAPPGGPSDAGEGEGEGEAEGWPPGGPPPGAAAFLDLRPTAAADLLEGAERQALLSGLAAAGLVGLGLLASRAAGERAAADAALARGRHLAALGQVAGVMAHELRNPLAALKGHAQLLEEALEGPPQARAARVVHEAERLEKITEDLLAFARLAAIERAAVSPLALAREAAAADPARVQVLDAGAPPTWPLDALRARQLLDNLVGNALQIDESGKPVRVKLGLSHDGAALLITVEDEGPGLPEGELDRLFEPFFTTRARGTGLGLAVARRCAELHGGALRAERRAEGGARFVATFPKG